MSNAARQDLSVIPDEAWRWLRPADVVLDPDDMGGARATRHSFARSLVRHAVAFDWAVQRELFDVDEQGRGTVIYRVDAQGEQWRVIAFSQVLQESEREDRVIAGSWDVTMALVEGELSADRVESLRENVPRQEGGRADEGAIIWARGNRSTRFFGAVVGALAAGRQPDPRMFGASPYVMRSTAFYSNGKFGLADFERFGPQHPFSVPYRPHFLTAWLMRELSCDLVEHCARMASPDAVELDEQWRRYLGLGNATGLGMVPYVINHPQILDAWAHLREVPLAVVRSRLVRRDDPSVARVVELLRRAERYLVESGDMDLTPFPRCTDVAVEVAQVGDLAAEYAEHGTVRGVTTTRPWDALHDEAAALGPACRGVVASILVELTDELDSTLEWALSRDETSALQPQRSCASLRRDIDEHYGWVGAFDFDDPSQQAYFWFSSAENEEPRRGRRDADPGAELEHGTDIARSVWALRADLEQAPPQESLARFLLRHPWHRGAVSRVQSIGHLRYGEVRANTLAQAFLPLNVQRLQLAVYGMENFVPQSTDWLRVTLFSGAPRTRDLTDGTADDDWIFCTAPDPEPAS